MKLKFLITMLCVFAVSSSVFAGSKFIYGPSIKGVVHADQSKDYAIGNVVGMSFEIENPFFLIPDETYIVYNYTRSNIPDTNLSAGFHDVQIRGIYYFNNDSLSTSKFNPFFLVGVAYQAETTPLSLPTNDGFGGDFGLGFNYEMNDRWGLWMAGTARVAEELVANLGVGIYMSFLGQ